MKDKKGRSAMIFLGGCAAITLCLTMVFTLMNGPGDEKPALLAAISATARSSEKLMSDARKAIPALDLPRAGVSRRTELTFISADGLPRADAATALLTGSTVRLDSLKGGEGLGISAQLFHLGRELPEVTAYISPQTLAVCAPGVMGQALDLDPSSLLGGLADGAIIEPFTLLGAQLKTIDEYIFSALTNYAFGDRNVYREIVMDLIQNSPCEDAGTKDGAQLYRLFLADAQLAAAFEKAGISLPPASAELLFCVENGRLSAFEGALVCQNATEITLSAQLSGGVNVYAFEVVYRQTRLSGRVTQNVSTEKYALAVDVTIDEDSKPQRRASAAFTADAMKNYSLSADIFSRFFIEGAGKVSSIGGQTVTEMPRIFVNFDQISVVFSLKSTTGMPENGQLLRGFSQAEGLTCERLAALAQGWLERAAQITGLDMW